MKSKDNTLSESGKMKWGDFSNKRKNKTKKQNIFGLFSGLMELE